MKTIVASRSKEVVIGDGRPTIVIGEVSGDGNRQTLEKMYVQRISPCFKRKL